MVLENFLLSYTLTVIKFRMVGKLEVVGGGMGVIAHEPDQAGRRKEGASGSIANMKERVLTTQIFSYYVLVILPAASLPPVLQLFLIFSSIIFKMKTFCVTYKTSALQRNFRQKFEVRQFVSSEKNFLVASCSFFLEEQNLRVRGDQPGGPASPSITVCVSHFWHQLQVAI